MSSRLFFAFALATIAVPSTAATNLVLNGSFENGLTNWTLGGTDPDKKPPAAITYGQAKPYPVGAYGEAVPADNSLSQSPDDVGTHGLYFVSDLAHAQSLTQAVYLKPGNYKVGFSAYAPGNGYANIGDALFKGSIAGVTLANYAVSTGPRKTWQAFSGDATILSPGTYDVAFLFDTNRRPSKDVVIDRVYIFGSDTPGPVIPGVPEPTTWAMLVAGFGLMGAGLRRRTPQVLS